MRAAHHPIWMDDTRVLAGELGAHLVFAGHNGALASVVKVWIPSRFGHHGGRFFPRGKTQAGR